MVIETRRLILRPFLESDAADVYEYLKEPAVNCFAIMKLNSLDADWEEMKNRLGEPVKIRCGTPSAPAGC